MSSLLALLLASTVGFDPRPTQVDFTAPADCPGQADFERELSARTDRVRFVSSEATAFVSVTVVKKGRRFEGRVVVKTADGARSRKTLESPRCETLVGALTLTTALVLDPEGAKLGPVLPAPVELPPPLQVEPPPVEPPAPVVVEPPPAVLPPPAPVVVVTPVVPSSPPTEVEVELSAAFVLSSGVSGAIDLGAGGRVALDVGPGGQPLRFTFGLAGAGLTGRTVTSTAGSARYAPRFVGEVEVAASWVASILRVQVGGFAQLAPVLVEGLEGDEVFSSQRFLWAVGPSVRVALLLGKWSVGVRAGAAFALRLESYVIDPNGLVFGVPPVALTGGLEVGRRFP